MQTLKAHSVAAGTLVSLVYSPAPIETLAVGDRVWAYDPVELVWSLKPVLATVTPHYHGKLITLDLGEEQLQVTTSHPFWVVTGDDLVSRPRPAHVDDLSAPSQTTGRWVDSEHLRPGDFLLTKSGTVLRLESVAIRDVAGLPVYNFTVGDLHCYAVMNCEVLVHNTDRDCIPDLNQFVARIKGVLNLYPSVIDLRTGRPIQFPSQVQKRLDAGDRTIWDSGDDRAAYIREWYRRGYTTPPGGWRLYDIHHILPLQFGGDNSFWNLVPVLRTLHQKALNKFWREFTGL